MPKISVEIEVPKDICNECQYEIQDVGYCNLFSEYLTESICGNNQRCQACRDAEIKEPHHERLKEPFMSKNGINNPPPAGSRPEPPKPEPQSTGQEPKEYCEWKEYQSYDNNDSAIMVYKTGCGETVYYDKGKFCPFCGKPVKEVK